MNSPRDDAPECTCGKASPCVEELRDGAWRVSCYGCLIATFGLPSRKEAIDTWNRRAPARRADQPARVVKPLVWSKSHIEPWNDDWHTVPTGYTIRCADENGWKWSTPLGAFGYGNTAAAAKAAAQADYERRILAALLDHYRRVGQKLRPLYATPPAAPTDVQCCMCGTKDMSIIEGDGGPECQMHDGRWCCSRECWDKAHDEAAPTDNTALVEALKRCLRVFEHHGLSGGLSSDIKDILAALSREAPQAVTFQPTHQHVKRGTEYQEMARGRLQTDVPLSDYADLVAYKDADGVWWFRSPSEFDDGRFRALGGRT